MKDNSLGIYLHIPFCKSRCYYCNFVSSCGNQEARELYCNELINRINGNLFGPNSSIDNKIVEQLKSRTTNTIYMGGGTPTILQTNQLVSIIQALKNNFHVSNDCEITIECNPNTANLDKFKALIDNSVNRLSIGLQSCNDEVLKSVNRSHNYKEWKTTIQLAKQAGFSNISSDVIIGLPNSTRQDTIDTVQAIIDSGCKHISVYSLSVEKGTKLEGYIVDEDECGDTYYIIRDMLSKQGFNAYETSNFSIPGYESKHNLKYWTMEEYLGLGIASHGYFNGMRVANGSNPKDWYKGNINIIKETDTDYYNDYVMLALRLKQGINLNDYYNKFHKNLLEFCPKVSKFVELGLLVNNNSHIYIADKYQYVPNSIIAELLID